ncbi:Predicted N-acyltransferase, GNAT family [Terribacillus halophilus]|uniref:Predicted N-acyltransferase, GNAT family n=1 Tax=Terribacillus halophilus TaxID=361279 RepID=A0A1G6QTI8_9BACI|nr:GNAT family N-acetyltransferase [Terribacillus halophilus]SDC95749.1 Predicted N-acyltransferase, GNAT family [Terribacillus halophilus]
MPTYKIIQDKQDFEKAKAMRVAIFVEEQGVPLEDEFDQFDVLGGACQHILVYHEGEAVGTGRLRFIGNFGKMERICITKGYRKFGLGRVIIASLEEVARQAGKTAFKLHAQVQASGFYRKLGYTEASEIFDEDGIPHIIMEKKESVTVGI